MVLSQPYKTNFCITTKPVIFKAANTINIKNDSILDSQQLKK